MKRIWSAILVTAIVINSGLAAFAASAPKKIKSLHPQFSQMIEYAEMDGVSIPSSDFSSLKAGPGSILRVYLVGQNGESLFLDQQGQAYDTPDITAAKLRAGQISVKTEAVPNLVEAVELNYSHKTGILPCAAPYIQLKFSTEANSLADVPFRLDISLLVAGQEQARLYFAGDMRSNKKTVRASDRVIDASDGSILVAEANISHVSVRLHDDIVIEAAMKFGEFYSGSVSVEYSAWDGPRQMNSAQGSRAKIYTLKGHNLDRSGNMVRIQSGELQYVYNAQGAYIGTTRDLLPYSAKYIVVGKKWE